MHGKQVFISKKYIGKTVLETFISVIFTNFTLFLI